MRHQKVISVLLVMLMLLATACTGNDANGVTAKKTNGLPANTPTHLSQTLGKHVTLNADVVIPEGIKEVPILKANILKLTPRNYDQPLR